MTSINKYRPGVDHLPAQDPRRKYTSEEVREYHEKLKARPVTEPVGFSKRLAKSVRLNPETLAFEAMGSGRSRGIGITRKSGSTRRSKRGIKFSTREIARRIR
jgi:hypothetical protein